MILHRFLKDWYVWLGLAIGVAGFGRGAFSNPSALGSLWQHSSWNSLMVIGASAVVAGIVQGICRRPQAFAILLGSAVALLGFGLPAFTAVALVVVSAFALGARLLAIVQDGRETGTEVFTSTIVGLSAFSLLLGFAAHLPINVPAFYFGLSAAAIALGRRQLRDSWKEFAENSNKRSNTPLLVRVALWLAFGLHFSFAALPERYPDALAMHLVIARAVELFGEWSFNVQDYVWAVQPMGANWLFTWAYVLGGEHAAMLANATFLALMCGVIANANVLPMRYSLLAAAILALTPLSFLATATLFVENTLTMFVVAAILFAAQIKERVSPALAASFAIASAGAVSAKLHGLIAVACACLALLLFGGWRELCHSNRRTIIVGLIAALGALAPYGYAWYATGNPVFPYFNAVFKSEFYPSQNFSISTYPGGIFFTDFYELTFFSGKYLEAYDGAGGYLIPLLLPAGLLAVAAAGSLKSRFVAFTAITYVILILLNTRYLRYLFPAFPLLALILACPLFVASGQVARGAVLVIAAVGLGWGLLRIPAAGWILHRVDLTAAFSPRAKQLRAEAEVPMRKLGRIQAALGSNDSRVLIFGWPAGGDIRGRPVYTNWYFTRFAAIAPMVQSTSDAARALATLKITHVMFDQPDGSAEWAFWRTAAQDFGRLVAQVGTGELYELDVGMLASLEPLDPAFDDRSAVNVFDPAAVPWQEWNIDADQKSNVAGADLTLPAKAVVSRAAGVGNVAVDGQVVLSVKHVCSVPGVIGLQINWLTTTGSISRVDSTLSNCGGAPRTGRLSGTRPADASAAFFYFMNQGEGNAHLYDERVRTWEKKEQADGGAR